MGTAKRERQKANKAQREAELARQAAKSKSTRLAAIVIGAIVGVFLIVVVAGQFVGGDDDETPTTTVPVVVPDSEVE